jgi:hypothetical protein
VIRFNAGHLRSTSSFPEGTEETIHAAEPSDVGKVGLTELWLKSRNVLIRPAIASRPATTSIAASIVMMPAIRRSWLATAATPVAPMSLPIKPDVKWAARAGLNSGAAREKTWDGSTIASTCGITSRQLTDRAREQAALASLARESFSMKSSWQISF